jgi:two-component system response regulator RstA
MTSSQKILMVDDDVELTQLVSQYLSSNGFIVHCMHTGNGVLEKVTELKPDLLILDLMLPGIDGLSVCKSIRGMFQGAIIMLTALGDDIDEVTGLEVGADDYLAKPVKPRVLLAHLRAQLRRQGQVSESTINSLVYCYDQQIKMDASKRYVEKNGVEVVLSSAEFDLLWLLAQNVGNIVDRESLHQKIFRLPYDGVDRSIDLRISRIRKKLFEDPKEPQIIKTVRNVGYLLVR